MCAWPGVLDGAKSEVRWCCCCISPVRAFLHQGTPAKKVWTRPLVLNGLQRNPQLEKDRSKNYSQGCRFHFFCSKYFYNKKLCLSLKLNFQVLRKIPTPSLPLNPSVSILSFFWLTDIFMVYVFGIGCCNLKLYSKCNKNQNDGFSDSRHIFQPHALRKDLTY